MNMHKVLAAAAAVSLLVTPVAALATVDAKAKEVGFSIDAVKGSFPSINQSGELIGSVINIINALLVLAAIAAIAFMIIGGVRYVTAQGDEDAVEQAKNTVIYAIIGIIIILLAAVIIGFFVQNLVGSPAPVLR